MSATPVVCPHCNSRLTPASGVVSDQRLDCDRCGESFVYRGPPIAPATPSASETFSAPVPTSPVAPSWQAPRSHRKVVLTLLALMGLVALATLTLALETVETRRSHDTILPKSRAVPVPIFLRILLGVYVAGLVGLRLHAWRTDPRRQSQAAGNWLVPILAVTTVIVVSVALVIIPGRAARNAPVEDPPARVATVRPMDLEALGYLPMDLNLVVGFHVAEARDRPAGRDLLRRAQVASFNAADLASWLGLRLSDLDHLVVGARVDEAIPRLTVVARTVRPYEVERVREALKAHRTAEAGKDRPVYRVELQTKNPLIDALGGTIWFPGEKTVVLHLSTNWTGMPLEPRAAGTSFQGPLREVMTERLPPSAHAWAVGHVSRWDTGLIQLLPGAVPAAQQPLIRGLNAFSASLLCHTENVLLSGSIQCVDETAATTLRRYLEGAEEGQKVGQAAGGPTELWRDLGSSLQLAQEGRWLTLQATAPLPTRRAAPGE